MHSEVQFVRIYPFYLKLGANQAFSFSVTVAAQKRINPMTGMSVDLLALDQIAKKVLKNKNVKTGEVFTILKKLVVEIQKLLKLKNTKLTRLQFNESRGSSYIFTGGRIFFARQDFAQDKKGDLFKIKSLFNNRNELVQLNIFDFKSNLEEITILG